MNPYIKKHFELSERLEFFVCYTKPYTQLKHSIFKMKVFYKPGLLQVSV